MIPPCIPTRFNQRFAILILLLILVLAAWPATGARAADRDGDPVYSAIIEKYRQTLPQIMRENDIPGLSLAIVDDTHVLWAEGFGFTDWNNKTPVTPDTLFSMQSASKSFTAVGVMLAVQDGLVDLDTPISEYLPNFHVNSIFEAHPEQTITLRHLLSHTAGFTHEAPIGNNYDGANPSFEEHVASISDTWLKFPVGSRYSYSNLGIDLAGSILQVRSGKPFAQYMRDTLLNPLGMRTSSFDFDQIMSSTNRAIGHTSGVPTIPVAVPMRAAGGLYASANDMARYLQFHINIGMVDGRRVLDERLLDTMYTVPSRAALVGDQYALGIGFQYRRNTYLMSHGGGGFGFLCDMFWYPKLKIGMVLLTNTADHELQGKLAQQIVDEFIAVQDSPYAARAKQPDTFDPAGVVRRDPTRPMSDDDLAALIRRLAPIPTEQDRLRWATYVGTYEVRRWGRPVVAVSIAEKNSQLYMSLEGMEHKLTEIRPGLLFMDDGEMLDLSGSTAIAQGIRIAKTEGAPLGAQPQAITMPDVAAIDAYIESEMRAARIPGLALAIVQGDQVVHLRGFGVADPSGRPMTPQTPSIIGSVSKTLTALAIMQLVEAGKLDLDTPVQRYLPWFRVADLDASARITVRQLLSHTSGLSEPSGQKQLADTATDAGALERHVRALAAEQLTQPVGTVYQYSNANYITLGMIVQAVAGESYEAYVQHHIFYPLAMRNSFTSLAEAQQHGLATGYRLWFGYPLPATRLPYPRGELPEGYLISSAEDLAHYLIAQLNDGRYGGATILSPQGIAELHRPVVTTTQIGSQPAGQYALGWHVQELNGVPVIAHDGDVPNYHADVVLVPEGRWGIAILTNANAVVTGERIRGIAAGVTSLLAGRQPPAAPTGEAIFALILGGLLLAVLTLQVFGLVRSVILLRRWRSGSRQRPPGWPSLIWHIGLPLALNLVVAALMLRGFPWFFGVSLPVMLLYQPDLAWMMVVSGSFALGWALARTALSSWILWRADHSAFSTVTIPPRA